MYKLILFFQVYLYIALAFVLKVFIKKPLKKPKSILFLTAFFPENAGYHWRVKVWADMLQKNGYTVGFNKTLE